MYKGKARKEVVLMVAGMRLTGDEAGEGCRYCIQDRTSTTGDVRDTCH